MTDPSQPEKFDTRLALEVCRQSPPLPGWLAARVLRPNEKLTWVYGPRFQPWWERHVTNPLLFVKAVAVGGLLVLAMHLRLRGVPAANVFFGTGMGPSDLLLLSVVIAVAIVLASIFVLGIFSGYFTRLVVTDRRLVLLQGYEVCRSWEMSSLPPSLLRYRMVGGGAEARTVNLDAVRTMLGTNSDKIVDAKTLLAFSKQLDRLKPPKEGHP
jgi:hypothetical protein